MPGQVFPSDAPRPTTSHGERTLWEALRKGLPKGWTAWHSLRVKDKQGFLGETDFVLAHPERGLLVLEVKSGTVEQQGGHWLQNGQRMERSPLDQALGFQKKLLSRLADARCQPPAWGAALVLPEVEVGEQPSQDDLAGKVLGRNDLPWLSDALPALVERALPPAGRGLGDWTAALHRLWGETWSSKLSLGRRVEDGKAQRVALDDEQLGLLDFLAEQDRVLVSGGAGTGKTLLAVEAARRERAHGHSVLLLCFTQPLKRWLEARVKGEGIDVHTASGLAKELATADGRAWEFEGLTEGEIWKAYSERAAEVCQPRWDAVIVDEAQDLTYEAWYLVEALTPGKRLWAFHDPGQAYWPERTPPTKLLGKPFQLRRGQRSPAGVELLARRYLGEVAAGDAIEKAMKAGVLGLVACPDPSRTAAAVGAELDRLRREGVALSDIGVVSLRGQGASSAVHRAPALGEHAFVTADAPDMEDRLVADSFLRWKGLERPVVIVADVDPALKHFGTRMHIALTRALTGARVVAPPGPGGAWPGFTT
ncbi:MAG: NERD domain-containing protein [Anaeromyxobacter sp.]